MASRCGMLAGEDQERTVSGPILVTGGTGTLGRVVTRLLLADGHQVRVLSRRPRPADAGPAGLGSAEWAAGDLRKGRGIGAAVAGVEAIVHCATGLGDVRAGVNLIEEARLERPRLVYISIVGIWMR